MVSAGGDEVDRARESKVTVELWDYRLKNQFQVGRSGLLHNRYASARVGKPHLLHWCRLILLFWKVHCMQVQRSKHGLVADWRLLPSCNDQMREDSTAVNEMLWQIHVKWCWQLRLRNALLVADSVLDGCRGP